MEELVEADPVSYREEFYPNGLHNGLILMAITFILSRIIERNRILYATHWNSRR